MTIKGKLPCSLVLEKAKEIEATDHHLNEQESENKLHDGISFNRLDPSKQLATNRNSQFKPKRFPNQKQHPQNQYRNRPAPDQNRQTPVSTIRL